MVSDDKKFLRRMNLDDPLQDMCFLLIPEPSAEDLEIAQRVLEIGNKGRAKVVEAQKILEEAAEMLSDAWDMLPKRSAPAAFEDGQLADIDGHSVFDAVRSAMPHPDLVRDDPWCEERRAEEFDKIRDGILSGDPQKARLACSAVMLDSLLLYAEGKKDGNMNPRKLIRFLTAAIVTLHERQVPAEESQAGVIPIFQGMMNRLTTLMEQEEKRHDSKKRLVAV